MKKEILKILIAASLISSIASIAFAADYGLGDLNQIIDRAKIILQAAGFIVAVIYIILGGYKIITAGGSKDEIETGRRYILYAVIGLAVILIAQALAKVACYIGTGNWSCATTTTSTTP